MRVLHLLALMFLALISSAVSAHELTMAEMEVRETAPGEFLWQWTASGDKAAAVELAPVWPESCAAQMNMLRCGDKGLFGTLGVNGVGKRYSAAIVKILARWSGSRLHAHCRPTRGALVRLGGG